MRHFLTLGLALLFSPAAFAVLGGTESSITNDEVVIKASSHVRTAHGSYTIHQLQGSINKVTEYADANGTVFAVTWRGPVKPDLNSLLGTYYSEFEAVDAARVRAKGGRHIASTVQTSQIVVERAGHMRDLRGRAYIPSQMPAGVQTGELP